MNKITFICSLILISVLSGCETYESMLIDPNESIVYKKNGNSNTYYSTPTINEEIITFWGSPILKSKIVLGTIDYIYLRNEYSSYGKKDYHPVGAYKLLGYTDQYAVYKNPNNISSGNIYSASLYAMLYEDKDGIIYYDYKDKEKIVQNSDYNKVVDCEEIANELRFTPIAIEGSVIRFLFEYYDDMNIIYEYGVKKIEKKVSEKSISYDMKNGMIIRYKSAIIEIKSFNNQEMKYKVLSGFSENDIVDEAYANIKY